MLIHQHHQRYRQRDPGLRVPRQGPGDALAERGNRSHGPSQLAQHDPLPVMGGRAFGFALGKLGQGLERPSGLTGLELRANQLIAKAGDVRVEDWNTGAGSVPVPVKFATCSVTATPVRCLPSSNRCTPIWRPTPAA